MTKAIGEEIKYDNPAENHFNLEGLRALVVEDNELNTEVVKFINEA